MKTYRFGSTIDCAHKFMKQVLQANAELNVPVFRNKHGDEISRANLSTIVGRVKKENYPACTFYTYTDKCARLVMGVRVDDSV